MRDRDTISADLYQTRVPGAERPHVTEAGVGDPHSCLHFPGKQLFVSEPKVESQALRQRRRREVAALGWT